MGVVEDAASHWKHGGWKQEAAVKFITVLAPELYVVAYSAQGQKHVSQIQ